MNQPFYQNPNYYQPIYPNSYENRYVMPQQQNASMISGGVVDTFDRITANDVPMNSPQSVFLKSDMSEIQVKRWNGNGQIETITFKSDMQNVTKNELTLDDFRQSLDERLDKIEKLLVTKRTTKKESEVE